MGQKSESTDLVYHRADRRGILLSPRRLLDGCRIDTKMHSPAFIRVSTRGDFTTGENPIAQARYFERSASASPRVTEAEIRPLCERLESPLLLQLGIGGASSMHGHKRARVVAGSACRLAVKSVEPFTKHLTAQQEGRPYASLFSCKSGGSRERRSLDVAFSISEISLASLFWFADRTVSTVPS